MQTETLEQHHLWRAGDGPYVVQYTLQSATGTAVNLSGATIRWGMSEYRFGRFGATPLISKAVGSGIVITNAAGGVITVTITSADLTQTPGLDGLYRYELEAVVGGNRDTFAVGLIRIVPELLVA